MGGEVRRAVSHLEEHPAEGACAFHGTGKNAMKSLELFSGAGGLAKGLELAGFEHAAFVEFNKDACASLRRNFGAEKVFFGDVRDFDLSLAEGAAIVAGGPPCQPFSMGGKHLAQDDERDMFPHAIRAIERLKPKAFVFENVKGLLRASFAEYFDYILQRLASPSLPLRGSESWQAHLQRLKRDGHKVDAADHYHVQWQLLNAADYGVPQCRERVVMVGVRADLGVDWSFPAATHSEDRLLWEQYVSGEYVRRHALNADLFPAAEPAMKERIARLKQRYGWFEPELKPWLTVRDALQGIPDPCKENPTGDHIFRDGARSYPGHTGSDFDKPAKTLKAGGHGVPGGENMIRFADGSVRYFTVLEAKRLQTFPDDFVIQGAWGEAMRQIGNAVPVRLGEVIGRALYGRLNGARTTVCPVDCLQVLAA